MNPNARRLVVLICIVFLCGISSVTQSKPSDFALPKLEFRQRALTNGLQVISVEDHSTPTVAIHVWYRVGSKDDPEGRSGFAHLFEHLMFKATRNMKDEMLDRLTEDVGGFNNASTFDDFTNYYEVVPSNYLETLLWAEADRMASLQVTETNFPAERDVVKEEFRQNYLARPYGMLFWLLDKLSYTEHPYRHPGIGNIDELNAATLQDVREFHATYYRPDNAVLIVAGDFQQSQLDKWVDQYFAKIPKPDRPLPRVKVVEPKRKEEKQYAEYRPNVPLPAVALSYLIPPVKHQDTPALRMLETILSQGESSRLYQSLVYEQRIAQNSFASANYKEHEGVFALIAILASEKQPQAGAQALLAEIKKLQKTPVDALELEKARNQLLSAEVRERETNNGKAYSLGTAAVLLNDPSRVNTALQEIQAVRPADVQRVADKYFQPSNLVTIYYMDESQKAATEKEAKQ